MEKVVLGLGSNIGNRAVNLKKAIKEVSLIKGVNILAVSPVYETEPWGKKNQRDFLNCIIVCLCKLEPEGLIKTLKHIEIILGRRQREKWTPREIDIDILFFGSRVINNNLVEIPHPMIAQRNFVLVPLNDLMPDLIHPVLKKKISAILQKCTDTGKISGIY